MVAEQGVRSVSFREVARRAGVSHQAPYHHFGSTQGILRALAQEGFAGLADAMTEAAEAAGDDSLAALSEAGVAYVSFARGHVGHFRVMFQKTSADVDEPLAPLDEALRTHATLVRLAEAVVRDGHGHGLTADMLAQLSWSVVHGFATLLVEGALANEKPRTARQEANHVRRLVASFAGLLGESKPARRRGRPRS
ncbi:TetR/AcrR family transcriptional regulator [Nannocystaceae bacterium ST9]